MHTPYIVLHDFCMTIVVHYRPKFPCFQSTKYANIYMYMHYKLGTSALTIGYCFGNARVAKKQ